MCGISATGRRGETVRGGGAMFGWVTTRAIRLRGLAFISRAFVFQLPLRQTVRRLFCATWIDVAAVEVTSQ